MPRLLIVSLLATVLAGTPLSAQRAEAAARARALLATAGRSLEAGDTAQAADSALAAARAWPRQGAWRFAAARLAAMAGREADAVAALRSYAAMGFAWDAGHPAFARIAGSPAYRAAVLEGERNRTPLLASSVFRTLPDADLHPEGVAFDPGTGRVFVSSVRQRKVVVLEPDGRVIDFVPTSVGLDAVFGLAVDTARGLLWMASAATPEQRGPARGTKGGSEVVAVELGGGAVVSRWVVPDTGTAHHLGDVVLAPDGTVYATDAVGRAVYRVPREGTVGELERVDWHHPDWSSLQGLAFSGDGQVAWLADWTTGLFVVDVASGRVRAVAAAAEQYTLGVDGLYRVGERRLVGLQNGIAPARVVAFDLDPAGDSVVAVTVLDRHLPLASEPTLATPVPGGLLYVANSPWGHYRRDGTPDPERPFPLPVLLRLPIAP